MSTFILDIVYFLQKIPYTYLYFTLGIYLLLIWLSFILWIVKDTKDRITNSLLRGIIVVLVSISFIFGLLIYLVLRPNIKDEEEMLENQYLKYEMYGIEKCLKCKFDLRPEFQFCPNCAEVIREKCKKCKEIVDIRWQICPFCSYRRIKNNNKTDLKTQKVEILKKESKYKFSNLEFKKISNKFINSTLIKTIIKLLYEEQNK